MSSSRLLSLVSSQLGAAETSSYSSKLFDNLFSSAAIPNESGFAPTTVMVCLLFATNALLFIFFQLVKSTSKLASSADELVERDGKDKIKDKDKEKELSKPFVGTLDCFYNLTLELFRTGLIMALTYICEKHWIFDHSGKQYSRDLFLFVLFIFFAYGFYTIKPVHDLSMLSREQTEEWKGWMQFIFLLYHYFHAEEVYNSVRVMITCYVWMTGFGNFSFFFIKQDFGWLRVVQMLWRLNFSVLLLMWTHGNTWILYYICPMHTFYFLMVYATMYIFSSVNHSKWGIRFKLLALGVLIFIIWDINGGIFDWVFAFLGTSSVIGAGQGSVWEYYFRTSLDHYSSFFGMIFAANYPLAEQFFVKAKGYPMLFVAVGMAAVTLWWYFTFYCQEKMEYNLTHSYSAIIPLTSYIFFRNMTPGIRSGVSMSLHDLGKTTLETYLLQHHIWLTSNAKTLLTIVPGHPWVNFALATVLFFTTSKELYRLTMSLRGMVMPDDKTMAWNNIWGMTVILTICYVIATALYLFEAHIGHIFLTSIVLFLLSLLAISKFARQTSESAAFQLLAGKASGVAAIVLCIGLVMVLATEKIGWVPVPAVSLLVNGAPFKGTSQVCQDAISAGQWFPVPCVEPPAPALNRAAYCQTSEWRWTTALGNDCPVARLSVSKSRSIFKNKHVVFTGDSITRGVYHAFINSLDSSYSQNRSSVVKHSDLTHVVPSSNTTIEFYWAPYVRNITTVLRDVGKRRDVALVVGGATAWNALHIRDLKSFRSELAYLSKVVGFTGGSISSSSGSSSSTGSFAGGAVTVWIQPTTMLEDRMPTADKRQFMSESVVQSYRSAFLGSNASAFFSRNGVVLNTSAVSKSRESSCVDGVHYGDEVYSVVAQMVSNAYSLRFPAFYGKTTSLKQRPPKPTGAMSFPVYGLWVLALASIMLFTMDSFLGIGFLSMQVFGLSFDWETAYAPMLRMAARQTAANAAALAAGAGGAGSSHGPTSTSSASSSVVSSASVVESGNALEMEALLHADRSDGKGDVKD